MTEQALNLKDWGNVEWFGIEELYVPYPYLDEYALAYSKSEPNGDFEFEVSESFPFLCAYKHGEFLCTIEIPFICVSGQIVHVTNFALQVKAPQKG